MIYEVHRIAELQLAYASNNTPEMQERGQIIRHDLPALLREYLDVFQASIGRFSEDLRIEGRDGIGRKTEAPWVRIYSESLSPSATVGFYVVIHFALNGQSFFVTVGCGASKWDSDRGDLVKHSDKELNRKVSWALGVLKAAGRNLSGFPDRIAIGSTKPLPRSFEKATILAKTLNVHTTDIGELVDTVSQALSLLGVIYEAYSQRGDLKASELLEMDLKAIVNATQSRAERRQGYGLTAVEREAVELHAMERTRRYFEDLGYKVTDTSANNPFDFLVERDGQAVKVEVKGSTSAEVDAVLMTSNEVDVHANEAGTTALAIVSGIALSQREGQPSCSGGELEVFLPWDISEWSVTPKAYLVARPQIEEGHKISV